MYNDRSLLRTIILYTVACVLGLVMIFPLFWMITGSFKTVFEMNHVPPVWIPSNLQWSNYVEVFKKAPFLYYFRNSVIFAVTNALMVILTSSIAGYIFARYSSRLMDSLFYVILATIMIPRYLIFIPLFISFNHLNLFDTLGGLILPGFIDAFGVFLVRQFMLTIPSDLFDAAEIDGCGILLTYRHVALPLCKSSLVALGIFTIVNRWDQLFWPLIITRSKTMRTISVGIASFQGMHFDRTTIILAASTIALIPILMAYFALQKQFIEGIAMTGLKQ